MAGRERHRDNIKGDEEDRSREVLGREERDRVKDSDIEEWSLENKSAR